jgi:cytochrome d ubiquinol oxidase subunit I
MMCGRAGAGTLPDMSAELLSRFQFALTASFHFIFPPISMGLGLLLVWMGWKYLRTKDPVWRQSSFFWVRVYGLVFSLGIATGIVQEFAFGMNWSQYSRFVGNVFGSLLAAEGVFAFALEGGFLGLLLFGGSRLGPRMWLLATALVVFGAHFSALWILMANSWMQTPAGYVVHGSQWGNQALITNFWSVVWTASFWPRLLHTWVASWMIGAALVMSVSAWYLLKGRHLDFAVRNLALSLPTFFVLAVLQMFYFGANMAIEVTNNQAPKLSAMEGVFNSQSCAPLYLVGWVDEQNQSLRGIPAPVPCLLSILSYQNPQATVPGLNKFPKNNWAPVNLVFQAYHVMIDLGFLFPLIGLAGVFVWWRRRGGSWGPGNTYRPMVMPGWLLWVLVFTVPLTEVATIAGWWTAEIGRQPWVVWNVLRTSDADSPVLTTPAVAFTLATFAVLYLILFALFLFLLDRMIRQGPTADIDESPAELPDTFREVFGRQGRASVGAGDS